jgi:hypothetical protein
MALDDRQLAAVLQAIVDRTKELLAAGEGFLAFGTRCEVDGAIEFIDPEERDPTAFEEVYQDIGALLAEEAAAGTLAAAAVAAHVSLPEGAGNAVIIQLETNGVARSVTLPYRAAGNGSVAYAKMISQEAKPTIFTA